MTMTFPNFLADTRYLKVSAGVLLVTAAAMGTLLFQPQLRTQMVAQAASQLDKVAEALDLRSPGGRKVGELSKGKDALEDWGPQLPLQQRALGKIFPSPDFAITQPLFPALETALEFPSQTELTSAQPGIQLISEPSIGSSGSPGRGFSPPLGDFILLPPPGGLGTVAPIPPGGGTVISPPPEVPAVPEPSTWASLIVGFAFCAAAMRRRRLSSHKGLRRPCTQV
jgi:hypothetical protein